MSLFDNDRQFEKNLDVEQPSDENNENRLSEKTRASIWLILAVSVFMCAIIMCLSLISRSAETKQQATLDTHVGDIQYVVNGEDPSQLQTEDITQPSEITAPISVNDSVKFNYLLAAIDHETEQTDMLMILNIDTADATVALLSIPRDTYISGSYDVPKINRVYDENGDRGDRALVEATENMLGFKLDGYLLFDEVSLEALLDSVGGIEFDVPETPDYHTLTPGLRTLNGVDAFDIFRYQEDYTDVETEPCQVQRDFMLEILDRLLQDQEKLYDHAQLICETATTDISAESIAYFGKLLKDFRVADAYEAALPGGEINVDGESFYQVDIEKACERLNEYFNPMEEDLTEFSVLFRQKQDDSGVGEMPSWGFSNNTEATSNNREEPEQTESSVEESTEEPTEESAEDTTEEPTEESSATEELPEPLEPAEPGGDE